VKGDESSPRTVYLGDSEGRPPHWGGAPRAAHVLGQPLLATGERAWLVRIDPPLPRHDRPLQEAILMARYVGDRLEGIGDGSIIVNVLGPAEGIDLRRQAFGNGELVVEFWADAAESVEALPLPFDDVAFWADTLARIQRFIDRPVTAASRTGTTMRLVDWTSSWRTFAGTMPPRRASVPGRSRGSTTPLTSTPSPVGSGRGGRRCLP
jgi:hypothetical protein